MDEIVAIRSAKSETDFESTQVPQPQSLISAHKKALDAMLGIHVLNPYMKTGRCLIAVVDYLTEEIIYRMQKYHDLHPIVDWDWNPVYLFLEEERQRSLARMSRYGLEVNPTEFNDTKLLKRIITLKCIFGVATDLTRLNIAKHNIWLTSFSVGMPFNSFDHNLRQGNAMLGTLYSEDFLADDINRILNNLNESVSKIQHTLKKGQTQWYTGRWDAREYTDLMNALHTNHLLFDLAFCHKNDYLPAKNHIAAFGFDAEAIKDKPESTQIIVNTPLFHWELEFPFLFIDEIRNIVGEEAGFHAVICLPGFNTRRDDHEVIKKFLNEHFPEISHMQNVNWYYFAQGLRVLQGNGSVAMMMDEKMFITRKAPLQRALSVILES
jgi:hypothetical protein